MFVPNCFPQKAQTAGTLSTPLRRRCVALHVREQKAALLLRPETKGFPQTRQECLKGMTFPNRVRLACSWCHFLPAAL